MLISLLALALVDSINPSAIAVTVYRLGQGRTAAHVVTYIVAIFGTYLALGATMMLGLDAVLPSVRPLAEGRLGFIVQSLIGLAMLFYAVRAPAFSPSAPRTAPHAATFAAIALLDVTVTALEWPTAVPYFGVIALLTAANLSTAQWLPLLVVYNAIFVLPPVLLLAGHVVAGRHLEERYARPPRAAPGGCSSDDAVGRWSRRLRNTHHGRHRVRRPIRAAAQLATQRQSLPEASRGLA